ncbi:VOC family protein [Nonomuraea sp. NPDC050310]|uniref:VOC family protein n=1 Tax=unclassified Nonomuraea TaxID=2593643 RepID=UPI0033D589EB
MQKIATHLWFDTQAVEAAEFYTSIFPNSRIVEVQRFPGGTPDGGEISVVVFELEGQLYYGLNAGPEFKFNEAISLYVHCETQEEVDTYWDRLLEGGGEPGPCGWLKDRYGLSWQIVPNALTRMGTDPDKEKATRVMQAMMRMSKLDIKELEAAYHG